MTYFEPVSVKLDVLFGLKWLMTRYANWISKQLEK